MVRGVWNAVIGLVVDRFFRGEGNSDGNEDEKEGEKLGMKRVLDVDLGKR